MTFYGNLYEITSVFFHYGVGMKPVVDALRSFVLSFVEERFL